MATIKPASTFISSRSPIVDGDGNATFSFTKVLQGWDTKLQNGLNQIGQITQPIPTSTPVEGRTEGIGVTLQFLDKNGTVLAGGIDFARAYTNKDTDHITDGAGTPLAGGRVAYAALVASAPIAGQTLEFNGTHWLPVAIAVSKAPVAHRWLNGYDAATGTFTAAQPAFTDIAGIATAAQIPALSALSGQITAAQLPPGGFSGTITTAKLTTGGTNGSMTFVSGQLTAQVQAT
jgi:hypothetical protein